MNWLTNLVLSQIIWDYDRIESIENDLKVTIIYFIFPHFSSCNIVVYFSILHPADFIMQL